MSATCWRDIWRKQKRDIVSRMIADTWKRLMLSLEDTIDRSFITQEQKETYKSLLRDRLKRLLKS